MGSLELNRHARQCRARSKRTGERCGKWAMQGAQYCHMHGGKSLAGIAHPNFRTGTRSKYMMGGLAEKVDEAACDPDLLALREEIALVDGLIAERLERLDTGESDAVWKEAVRASDEIKKAASQDIEKLWGAAVSLPTIIDWGIQVRAAMADVVALIEQRRKGVESEAKRLEKMHQMCRYEEVALFIRRVFTSVRQHVQDQDALDAIAKDLHPLVRDEAGRRV